MDYWINFNIDTLETFNWYC